MVSANRFPSSLGLSMLSEMEREMHALSGRDDVKSRKKLQKTRLEILLGLERVKVWWCYPTKVV